MLDLGLAESTRERFLRRAVVFAPPWHFRPHSVFDSPLKWRSRSARPFLRDLFPGYDVYLWLDADTFVQSGTGLDWLVHAAGDAGAAVVPAVDRSYVHQPEQVAWVYKRYAMAFGADVAAQLMRVPYINAGVFAVKSDSLLWQRWAVRFQEALDRWEGDFLSDQAVLNAALLHDGVPHAKLPSICNWICHLALPRWLSARRLLIEPSPPYASLLIVDNTLNEKHRSWRILDEHLRTHDIELAYSTIRGDVEPRTVHER